MHSFFKLQQDIIPRKTTFIMKIHEFENENLVLSEKIEESQFPYFELYIKGKLRTSRIQIQVERV